MRRFLKKIFKGPVICLADKLSSRPDKKRVFKALSQLHDNILNNKSDKGLVIDFDLLKDKFIILSDQHKGVRNDANDFALAEKNYLAALKYYNNESFYYINLGDSEELWENTIFGVIKHNKKTFDAEQKFLTRKAFIKIFGNHDLYWDNDPLAKVTLKEVYKEDVKIYEGIILRTEVEISPY